jgi:hypothetical protein
MSHDHGAKFREVRSMYYLHNEIYFAFATKK